MERNLEERLNKLLHTLLIDYSEEEILECMDRIDTRYKKLNRKKFEVFKPIEKEYLKMKGVDNGDDNNGGKGNGGRGSEKQSSLVPHRRRQPPKGFTGTLNKVNGGYPW